jgi:enoyl-CoA hydratase/carnithine racemase
MDAGPKHLPIPPSYTSLPQDHIRLSHVPSTSPTATPIILVTLHRPHNHNAFTPTMMRELEHAFTLFDLDDRVKCVVVTGSGRLFCAGADLSGDAFVGGREANRDHRDGGGRVALAIHRCRKPVIGALQGGAVGIGVTMTLPMSIRVAYGKAKIGFVFARRGLIMEACSSFFLPKLIG